MNGQGIAYNRSSYMGRSRRLKSRVFYMNSKAYFYHCYDKLLKISWFKITLVSYLTQTLNMSIPIELGSGNSLVCLSAIFYIGIKITDLSDFPSCHCQHIYLKHF